MNNIRTIKRISDKGINSDEIANLLEKNGYVGIICSKNELVSQNAIRSDFVIVNTANRNREGEHWTCILMYAEICLYFDSFGIEIMDQEIKDYIFRCGFENYYYSTFPIQSFASVFCGFFVCAFIFYVLEFDDYVDFIELFDANDLHYNDERVLGLIKNAL